MTSPAGVLLDLDGTLIDSEGAHVAAFSDVLRRFSVEMTPVRYATEFRGMTNAEIFRRLLPDLDAIEAARVADEKEDAYLSRCSCVGLMRGAAELIAALERRQLRTGIVTNCPRRVFRQLSLEIPILRSFAVTITLDDVEFGKPHPQPYLAAVAALGLTRISHQIGCIGALNLGK